MGATRTRKATCTAPLASGPRAGEPCGKGAVNGSDPPRCRAHATNKPEHPKKSVVLEAYQVTGNVSLACQVGEIGRTTFYDWLDQDPEFARQALEAREIAADGLHAEAWRRAVEGVLEPVYQGGNLVGHVRKYDTTLLIVLLKATRPQQYRERWDATLTVDTGLPAGVGQDVTAGDDRLAHLMNSMRQHQERQLPPQGAIEAQAREHGE
jgi:hypothetical protein